MAASTIGSDTAREGQIVGFNGFTSIDPNAARNSTDRISGALVFSVRVVGTLVLDAAYVGNRGVCVARITLGLLNQVTPRKRLPLLD